MDVALLYGAAIGSAGWMLACAVASGSAERTVTRLGAPQHAPSRSGRQRAGAGRWLTGRAARRAWSGSARGYAFVLVGTAIGGTALGIQLAGPVGAVAGLVGGPLTVEAYLSRRIAVASQQAEEQLRDAVVALAAGVRAGRSIRGALEEAFVDAEPPLRDRLRAVLERLDVGEPLEVGLEELAEGLDLPDIRLVITVLATHKRTGGDLPVVLDQVAEIIGQRVESRRQVRALTAQGRASGAVLALLPVAFVALLSWSGGDGLGAFYRTPFGAGLLLAGLLCDVIGFAWIRRIVRASEVIR